MRLVLLTITVILGAIMELIDTSIVNVALNQISGNLGVTTEDVAWVITSYAIANVITIPITGFLSNLLGRKRYYMISVAIFTLFSLLCGTANSLWTLVIFRFFQGVGGGALLSTSQAILLESYSKEKRNLASAIFGIGVFIGPTIGPTLGGYLVDQLSWNWIFLVNIPLGIMVLVATFFLVDDSRYSSTVKSIDWLGLTLLIISIGSLQVVLERGEIEDWFDAGYITFLSITAIAGLISFVIWELRTKSPIVNLRVLSNRTLSVAAVLTFISGIGIYSSIYLVPLFTQRVLHYSALQTGQLLMPGAILAVFFLLFTAKSLEKGVSPIFFVFAGLIVFSICCYQLSSVNVNTAKDDLFSPLILRAVGISIISVPLTGLAISGLKLQDIAQGAALNNMMRQLGGSFGIAVVNTFMHQRFWYHKAVIGEHISMYDSKTTDRLSTLTKYFESRGNTHESAFSQAIKSIEYSIETQSYVLTYSDSFVVLMFTFLASAPVLLFVTQRRKQLL